jgi:hypothetical protein
MFINANDPFALKSNKLSQSLIDEKVLSYAHICNLDVVKLIRVIKCAIVDQTYNYLFHPFKVL